MEYPFISIVIPTFNSQETLPKTLESIKKQTYPQKKIEILVIDGGSTDATKGIAKKYGCRILSNPKTDLIYGKHIGFLKAKGSYLMFLDSDEVLENPQSLKLKIFAFKKDNRVKAVMLGGYKTPPDYSPINHYINEFGDPFSFFVYRESKGEKFLLKDFSRKYKKIYEDKNCVLFDFSTTKILPLIELWAGGCMIDLQYARTAFPQIKKKPNLIAHLFYLLTAQHMLLAITKRDPTIHYSSATVFRYLKKIISRVKNNVFQTSMGEGGYLGRERFSSQLFGLKKYFFIPYSFSLIFPAVDAINLFLSRNKNIYLAHLPLCLYTAVLILYYSALKMVGMKPKMKTYGN